MTGPESLLPDLPPPPAEEFPRRFGAYVLLSSIARGGMGEVFLAKSGGIAGLEKLCVLKTLRPHLTDDREYTLRFIDEARLVVQLNHRNICHVFDVGVVGQSGAREDGAVAGGRYYVAMELIQGRDLRSLAQRAREHGSVLASGLAIHVVCEMLEALDYAHRRVDATTGQPLQLVHRDVSPQNIMISYEGEVKLIDFGLAASTLKVEQTQPNVVMGKLAYMAPEQLRGERVDGRADMFAVAICLAEILVGERFYEGRTPYEMWSLASEGGYRPRAWLSIPEPLRAILDRALATDAKDRYATCDEMRDALKNYAYANNLRSDGTELRLLVQQLFASEIAEDRAALQRLARSDTPVTAFIASPSESTVSVARRQAALAMLEEASQQLTLPPRPSRVPWVAAIAVAFFVSVVALYFWLRSAPQPPTATATVQVVTVPAPSTATPPAPPTNDTALETTPTTETPAAEPKPAAVPVTVKKKDPVTPTTTQPTTAETPPTTQTPAAETIRPFASYTKTDRRRIMDKQCQLPCVADIDDKLDRNWGGGSTEAVTQLVNDMRSCWVACGLPTN